MINFKRYCPLFFLEAVREKARVGRPLLHPGNTLIGENIIFPSSHNLLLITLPLAGRGGTASIFPG
jgi:hypothetical protein